MNKEEIIQEINFRIEKYQKEIEKGLGSNGWVKHLILEELNDLLNKIRS
jgi:hypothetical protein